MFKISRSCYLIRQNTLQDVKQPDTVKRNSICMLF